MTGDDQIKGEYKGGAIFYFRNHAKMIFSCNELPKVLDEKSNGFYRRLLIIRFSESGEYVPSLKAKLAEESEKEAVISGVVSSLKSALLGGKLFESSENISEIEGLKYESDTVAAFLSDVTEKQEKGRVKRGDLYSCYRNYCFTEGRVPLGKTAFFKSMRLKGYRDIPRDGTWYFFGLDIAFKQCIQSAFD